MNKTNYKQKSIELLRGMGWQADSVEWFDSQRMLSHDYLGCADVQAFIPGEQWPGALLVQVCAAASRADRIKKVLSNKKARAWVEGGYRLFWVMYWKKEFINSVPTYPFGINSLYTEHFEIYKQTGEIPPPCPQDLKQDAATETVLNEQKQTATVLSMAKRIHQRDSRQTKPQLSEKGEPGRLIVFTIPKRGK